MESVHGTGERHTVGDRVDQINAPAAVLDLAIIKRNCDKMLHATTTLGVQFRAHVKTHKTIPLAKLQVGDTPDIRLLVSTVYEIQHMLPWLKSCRESGRSVDIIYGVPASLSNLRRLIAIQKDMDTLFPDTTNAVFSISVLIDNAHSVLLQEKYNEEFKGMPYFIKIECGSNRAGVLPETAQFTSLLAVLATKNDLHCKGLYTHLGTSYNANSPAEAIDGLFNEIRPLEGIAKQVKAILPKSSLSHCKILSVGATPTATAAQNFLGNAKDAESMAASATEFSELKKRYDQLDLELELHAGCYPILDIQQIATHARPAASGLSYADIGLRIAADVVGRYYRNGKHEALVSTGSLALGREPCKSYPGWGIVAPKDQNGPFFDEENGTGWIVGRITQEHGVLTWEGGEQNLDGRDLKIGDRVMIWPNHACITGAMFDEYAIVDSDKDINVVSEVWPRCRGW